MAELTKDDARDRIEAMISPGSKWDLSPNDHAALESVLAALTIAEARAEKAEHALREAGRSLDSDARTIDDLHAQSESWRRGHGAWQTWAEEMLRVRGMQPEGGLLGDGPARDALRARLERAEFTLTSRTFDEKEGLIETLRARLEAAERARDIAEMWSSKHGTEAQDLRAKLETAERERDSWRSQAAVEATCLGRVSERADALEARVRDLKRERDEAMAVAQQAMDNEYAGAFARGAAEARVRELEQESNDRLADAYNNDVEGMRYRDRADAAEARVRELEEELAEARPYVGSEASVYADARDLLARIDAVLKKGGAS